ncbi:hypothetical protein WOC76_23940 [Methylocystis sp. IM3]|uniref:hypothetical protein n=1 Tax=unclassified Methylocystis TaxID=2625913 RepID=UPI003119C425
MENELLNVETRYKGWTTLSIARIRLPSGQIIQRVMTAISAIFVAASLMRFRKAIVSV